MTPMEALEELDKILAKFPMDRDETMRGLKAIGVIKQALAQRPSQPEVPKPDAGEPT